MRIYPSEKDIAQKYPPHFVVEEMKRSYRIHCGWGKVFALVSVLGIFVANSHATSAYILLGCASLMMLVDAYRDRVILMALDERL